MSISIPQSMALRRLPTALVAAILCLANTRAADSVPESKESKWSVKGKAQIGGKSGNVGTNTSGDVTAGSGRVSTSIPAKGDQEMSVSVKVFDANAGILDVNAGIKANVKTESLGNSGQNKDNIYDERNFGSVTVSGAVTAGAKVGADGVSVGAEYTTNTKSKTFVIDQKSSPFWRDRAEVLDKADKEINRDQLEADAQARQNQPPAAPYKPKTTQEVLAEQARLEAEMKKLGLSTAKEDAPAVAPPPSAPVDTPMAATPTALSNGWLVFHRPANIDSGTWALYLDAFKKEFSTKPWIREIKENGEELRLRFEGQSDADLDASSQGSESYLTILRDPKTTAANPPEPVAQTTPSLPAEPPTPAAQPGKTRAPAPPPKGKAAKPEPAKTAMTPHDGYWFDPADKDRDTEDPFIYVRLNGQVERVPLSKAKKDHGVPDDAEIENMTWYSERGGKVVDDKGTHRSKGSRGTNKFSKPRG